MSVANEPHSIAGFSPHMAALFRYSEPRRPVRAMLRGALLTVVAMLAVNPS